MMLEKAYTLNLSGSSYKIGYELGKIVEQNESFRLKYITKTTDIDINQIRETNALFDRWCPGLTEELTGFADALHIKAEYIFFYSMTCFIPRCSQIALLSAMTDKNKPLIARNYEYSCELEDFCLVKTEVDGKYTHIGTSMLQFGRDDGFNECGLAVTMSSCGMPVVNLPYMKKPQFNGLQYWVVVRALLENCKNVKEALEYLSDMPIVFNMNMILLDKTDNAALIQTMDGQHAIKQIDSNGYKQMLHATNHSVLPEFMNFESHAFSNSIERYNYIKMKLKNRKNITKNYLKDMLLTKYPKGLCFHNYIESFGTTKSMIISPLDGTIELCWGGQIENAWRLYDISKPLNNEMAEIKINIEEATQNLFDWHSF